MAQGRKIQATFSDGKTLSRTTTMALTHAWRFMATRPDGSNHGMTGFASSHELAEKAIATESNRVRNGFKLARNRRPSDPVGELLSQEIVEVVEI